MFAPSTSACHSASSASTSHALTNVFHNWSVQIIQTAQPLQLPPLSPPVQAARGPPLHHAHNHAHLPSTCTPMEPELDILHFLNISDIEELENF